MLRFISRQVFFLQMVLFLGIASYFWIPSLIHPSVARIGESDGPLFSVVASGLSSLPLLSSVLAFLIVVSISVLLYFLLSFNDLLPRENFLPALLAMVILSWDHQNTVLNSQSTAFLMVLYSMFMIMKMYGEQEPYKLVFSASFGISVASTIYLPSVYLLPFIWFSFVTYRITSWREWMISFIGFLIPLIYLFSFFYLTDQFTGLTHKLLRQLTFPGLSFYGLKGLDITWLITTILILLITIFTVTNNIQDKLISQRRKTYILINLLLAVVISSVLSAAPIMEVSKLLGLPLAAFMALVITLMKKPVVVDILMSTYLIMLVIFSLI